MTDLHYGRHEAHGYAVTYQDQTIGFVTRDGATWTAKDAIGRSIRARFPTQKEAGEFVLGRHQAEAGNENVTDVLRQLTDAAENYSTARELRDDAVVAAHRAGASYATIADAAGLSTGGVHQLLKRMGHIR